MVKDIEVVMCWYLEVFGLKYFYIFGWLFFFDCEGLWFFLFEGDGGGEFSLVLYFWVLEIYVVCEVLCLCGVEVISVLYMIYCYVDGVEEWMVFFNDNEGWLFGLMSSVVVLFVV